MAIHDIPFSYFCERSYNRKYAKLMYPSPFYFSAVTRLRHELQILLDRTSLEVFGNEGQIPMKSCFLPDLGNTGLGCCSLIGKAKVVSMNVYEMNSAWP